MPFCGGLKQAVFIPQPTPVLIICCPVSLGSFLLPPRPLCPSATVRHLPPPLLPRGTAEEYEQYQRQHGFITAICTLYEQTPNDFGRLVDLLQQARSSCLLKAPPWTGLAGAAVPPLSTLRPSPTPCPPFGTLQMQQCGQPPQEIVDELAPGMQVPSCR